MPHLITSVLKKGSKYSFLSLFMSLCLFCWNTDDVRCRTQNCNVFTLIRYTFRLIRTVIRHHYYKIFFVCFCNNDVWWQLERPETCSEFVSVHWSVVFDCILRLSETALTLLEPNNWVTALEPPFLEATSPSLPFGRKAKHRASGDCEDEAGRELRGSSDSCDFEQYCTVL